MGTGSLTLEIIDLLPIQAMIDTLATKIAMVVVGSGDLYSLIVCIAQSPDW
jgi:hypothetical protein